MLCSADITARPLSRAAAEGNARSSCAWAWHPALWCPCHAQSTFASGGLGPPSSFAEASEDERLRRVNVATSSACRAEPLLAWVNVFRPTGGAVLISPLGARIIELAELSVSCRTSAAIPAVDNGTEQVSCPRSIRSTPCAVPRGRSAQATSLSAATRR